MALLQIAEPGQSTDPHHCRLAVGIDLVPALVDIGSRHPPSEGVADLA